MDLMTGLSSVQQILEITKDLRKIDEKINVAEFKLRLSEMVDRLLEAKEALQDAREEQRILIERIRDLETRISRKEKLEDENGLLFEKSDSGERVGEPYCNLCFVKEEKLFRMRHREAEVGVYAHYRCDNCSTIIRTGPSLPRAPKKDTGGSWIR